MNYNPGEDSLDDIESRVRREIRLRLKRGSFEGHAHSGKIDSWDLEVTTAEVEDVQKP